MVPGLHCLKVYSNKLFKRSCCNSLTNSVHDLALWLELTVGFIYNFWCYLLSKTITYDDRPEMKGDARLKAVFFPLKRTAFSWSSLFIFEHLSYFRALPVQFQNSGSSLCIICKLLVQKDFDIILTPFQKDFVVILISKNNVACLYLSLLLY